MAVTVMQVRKVRMTMREPGVTVAMGVRLAWRVIR